MLNCIHHVGQVICPERRCMDLAFKNITALNMDFHYPYQKIGIDRLQLCNLAVLNIDIEKLFGTDAQICQVTKPGLPGKYSVPGTDRWIFKIKIAVKDNMAFFDLVIGCNNIYGNRWIEYANLDMRIPNEEGNLVPWHKKQYDEYIYKIVLYIYQRYHIMLGCDRMQIKKIEINCNIPLTHDFCFYSRPMKLLITLMDNHLEKLGSYERVKSEKNMKKLQAESFLRGNKSMEVIFYDKQRQLNETKKDSDKIGTPILRIEYKLKTKQKINAAIGTASWNEINDRLIADYFLAYSRKELSSRFQKWMEMRKKELVRLVKECRKNNSQRWHYDLMTVIRNRSEHAEIPFILDIEQVYEAVRMIPDKNRSRKIKSIDSILLEYNDVYKNKDINKAFEIISGIEQAYKNTMHQSLRR